MHDGLEMPVGGDLVDASTGIRTSIHLESSNPFLCFHAGSFALRYFLQI